MCYDRRASDQGNLGASLVSAISRRRGKQGDTTHGVGWRYAHVQPIAGRRWCSRCGWRQHWLRQPGGQSLWRAQSHRRLIRVGEGGIGLFIRVCLCRQRQSRCRHCSACKQHRSKEQYGSHKTKGSIRWILVRHRRVGLYALYPVTTDGAAKTCPLCATEVSVISIKTSSPGHCAPTLCKVTTSKDQRNGPVELIISYPGYQRAIIFFSSPIDVSRGHWTVARSDGDCAILESQHERRYRTP